MHNRSLQKTNDKIQKMAPLKIAFLFWIYKDLDVCIDRTIELRKYNPGVRIYCLFGGACGDIQLYRDALRSYVDDFYGFDEDRSVRWKWLNGDQMICRWFTDRGINFEWDTIFVAQWDLLMLAPIGELCGSLRHNQILLPALRPIKEVESFWFWVRPGTAQNDSFKDFASHVSLEYEMPKVPLCCQFMAAALPRKFLSLYSAISQPEIGFLEYKIPIFAQIWGFDFCKDHKFEAVWYDEKPRSRIWKYRQLFHAENRQVHYVPILLALINPFGQRVFHPFTRAWNFSGFIRSVRLKISSLM